MSQYRLLEHSQQRNFKQKIISLRLAVTLDFFYVNVRGLRSKGKMQSLFTFLKEKRYDVICLQETYVTKTVSEDWKKEWGGELYYHEHTADSAGQVIYVRKGMSCNVEVKYESQRILVVHVGLGGKDIAIVNIYAPNTIKDKLTFYDELIDVIKLVHITDIVICGDFNCVSLI